MRDLGFFVRVHRRLHRDEGGFTLVELLVAVFIIATALFSLEYTATTAFGFAARARQRQDAVAIANQAIEKVRALAFANLLAGMATSDLTGDSAIVACGTAQCYQRTGETIVQSASPPTSPLNPHIVSGITVGNSSATYTRKVYVTLFQTSGGQTENPGRFHVTVVVSWQSDVGGQQTLIMDSVIDTTVNCPAGKLHPFAGPCQGLFEAKGSAPAATISISPAATTNTPFASGETVTMSSTGLSADMGLEQAAQVSGSAVTSGVLDALSGGSTSSCGLQGFTTAADNISASDTRHSEAPSSASDTTCSGPSSSPAEMTVGTVSGTSTYLELRKASADIPATAMSVSEVAYGAGDTTHCSNQTDAFPCGYDQGRMGGSQVALLNYYAAGHNEGNCPLVQIDAPATNSTVFINRDAPTSSTDVVTTIVTSYLPTITLGCIPSNLTPPWANWNGHSNRAFNSVARGYWVQFSGWTVTLTTQAGTGAAAPSVSRSGTITFWNPGTSDYQSCAVNGASASTCGAGVVNAVSTPKISADGNSYCVLMQPNSGLASSPYSNASLFIPAISSTSTGSTPVVNEITQADTPDLGTAAGTATPPAMEFRLASGTNTCSNSTGTPDVDVEVIFNTGLTSAQVTYNPAPT